MNRTLSIDVTVEIVELGISPIKSNAIKRKLPLPAYFPKSFLRLLVEILSPPAALRLADADAGVAVTVAVAVAVASFIFA